MIEEIDERSGLRMVAYDDCRDVDFPGLAQLADVGWRHDYQGQVRIGYDESYLRWLLDGNDWLGLIVHDAMARPMACTFSLFRRLQVGTDLIAAAYSCQMVVHPACRRLGVAMWLSDRHKKLIERYARDAVVSMIHEGHATGRIGQSRRDTDQLRGVAIPGEIWSKRLTGAHTAAHTAGSGAWVVRNIEAADLEAFAQMVKDCACPAFSASESFGRMYLRSSSERSGTLWCSSSTGAKCAINFSKHSISIDDVTIGTVAQIQCVFAPGCDRGSLGKALRAAVEVFQNQGCVAVCSLDQGGVDRDILEALGFAPSGDRLTLCIGGGSSLVKRISEAGPRFILDFL